MLKKTTYYCAIATFLCFFVACNAVTDKMLRAGMWRATLTTETGKEIPFNFELIKTGDGENALIIQNSNERIRVEETTVQGDTIFIKMPVFDSEIVAVFDGQILTGKWIKHLANKDVAMAFKATPTTSYRFATKDTSTTANISGNWQTLFTGSDNDSTIAIGEFKQEKTKVTGTFLTPTGDYRFLEGAIDGKQLSLSCFDGSHAFLFTAELQNDSSLINGKFYSGFSSVENWTAQKTTKAILPNAYTLTYLKPGYNQIAFSFPNLEGKLVSLSDTAFQNKVIILQIMGSWCPNCMDETAYLTNFYDRYKSKGVEIIGLAYERSPEFDKAVANVKRLQQRFYIAYPLLIAGTNDKEKAQQTLPMLNKVLAFPTTIIIDKKGNVSKIHTGFTGPATGNHYTEFVTEFEAHIDKLLTQN